MTSETWSYYKNISNIKPTDLWEEIQDNKIFVKIYVG